MPPKKRTVSARALTVTPKRVPQIDIHNDALWCVYKQLSVVADRRAFRLVCRQFAAVGYRFVTRLVVPAGRHSVWFLWRAHALSYEFSSTLRYVRIGRAKNLFLAWHALAAFWQRRVMPAAANAVLFLDESCATIPESMSDVRMPVRYLMFPTHSSVADFYTDSVTWAMKNTDRTTLQGVSVCGERVDALLGVEFPNLRNVVRIVAGESWITEWRMLQTNSYWPIIAFTAVFVDGKLTSVTTNDDQCARALPLLRRDMFELIPSLRRYTLLYVSTVPVVDVMKALRMPAPPPK